jgi:hypothetical protein
MMEEFIFAVFNMKQICARRAPFLRYSGVIHTLLAEYEGSNTAIVNLPPDLDQEHLIVQAVHLVHDHYDWVVSTGCTWELMVPLHDGLLSKQHPGEKGWIPPYAQMFVSSKSEKELFICADFFATFQIFL